MTPVGNGVVRHPRFLPGDDVPEAGGRQAHGGCGFKKFFVNDITHTVLLCSSLQQN